MKRKHKCKTLKLFQTTEAEVDAYVAIATTDEYDEEIERDKHKKSVKLLTINYNQVLRELKKKKAKIVKLKGRQKF